MPMPGDICGILLMQGILVMPTPDACMYAEIRTRIPDTISWDYHFEHAGNTPVTFTVKSAVKKESIATRPPISNIQRRRAWFQLCP